MFSFRRFDSRPITKFSDVVVAQDGLKLDVQTERQLKSVIKGLEGDAISDALSKTDAGVELMSQFVAARDRLLAKNPAMKLAGGVQFRLSDGWLNVQQYRLPKRATDQVIDQLASLPLA